MHKKIIINMDSRFGFKFILVFIFIQSCFIRVCHCAKETIDNLEVIESLSQVALLKHHPQSAYSHSGNVTESFALLLEDLQNSNFTHQPAIFNCSSLSQDGSILPKSLCDDGTFSKCLTANDMLQLIPQSTKTVSEALARLCPLLLLQLHNSDCSSAQEEPSRLKPAPMAVWGYGLLFVTIISCCSLVGIIILPLLSKDIYQMVLMLFEGLAVGSLVGSSLFHLIPQTFKLVGQDEQHNYLWRSLLIFGGIYLFYVSERFMKVIIDIKKARKKPRFGCGENSREFLKPLPDSKHVGNGSINEACDRIESSSALQILTPENLNNQNSYKLISESSPDLKNSTYDVINEATHNHHSHNHHDHAITFEKGQSTIATVAWMIIFGDGLHNFIDGLSIGAAFSESILAGISISVAVICEEFPHELGDFAVLLSAGMSMRQALLYNFLSAITCYLGLVIGILLGDLAEGAPYIFALAAGMFLYISLVDMMGELSVQLEEARQSGLRKQLKVFLIQNIGILLGVAILFIMARYAEHFNFESLHFNATSSDSEEIIDETVKHFYSGLQEAKNLHSVLTN